MKGFPRKIQLQLNTPSELAIRKAIGEIEGMGADVRLTNAVVLLSQALDIVADFIDDKIASENN